MLITNYLFITVFLFQYYIFISYCKALTVPTDTINFTHNQSRHQPFLIQKYDPQSIINTLNSPPNPNTPIPLHFLALYIFFLLHCLQLLTVVQLVPRNKLFTIQPMMYKIRSLNDLISFENEECTCFGSKKHQQEQFLAKQNTQAASPPPNTFKNPNNEQLIRGGFKKSLKKQFVAAFQANKHPAQLLPEGHQDMKSPECTQKPREIREFLSPQNRLGMANLKTYPIASQPLTTFYPPKQQIKEFFTYKTIQPPTQLPITSFSSFPTQKAVGSPVLSPKPTKIQYNTTIVQKSPQPDRRAEQKRTFSPLSSKSVNREHYTVSSTIKPDRQEHRQRQIQHSDSSRIKVKVNQERIQKDEAYKSCVKFATLKSVISPSKHKNQAVKSKIDTTQSGIAEMKPKADFLAIASQPDRPDKIQLKSLNDHKSSLKKMDDVVEIYSQPDSQEHSDSDKESIVLGRLNEYGSMIAPTSYNSIIQEKFTRFNSMNFDLSQEIRRIQQADSQFLTN